MRLDRYIVKSRIVDIQSKTLEGALEELLKAGFNRVNEKLDKKRLKDDLLDREKSMTTYLGNGVALPHVRMKMKRRYLFAIGRCANGIQEEGLPEYREVRLIILLIASEEDQNYLNVLASLARVFKEKSVVDHMLAAPDLEEFRERVMAGFGGMPSRPVRQQNRLNRLLFREAAKVSKAAKCTAIMVFGDTFAGGIEITSSFPDFRTILVTRASADRYVNKKNIDAVIEVRSYSNTRLSQLRSAVLIGITRGIIKFNDRLCCIGGTPSSNQLDTLVVVDVEREFQSVLTREADILPSSVKVEVIERIFAIATELAVEGREGKPVGSLFIVGDSEKVNTMVKPLVMNPFYGYKEEDRNVLNPFMDETVKELSSIDGAFVIRGDGVVESAGSLVHTPSEFHQILPGGYGSRHAAAASISRATNCIAIVVSSSTGQVTLFRRGVMLPLLEKSLSAKY